MAQPGTCQVKTGAGSQPVARTCHNTLMPVFTVDKPLGVTSHDVVAQTRKLLKTKKVGHAGTLDPLATGVLTILTEEATKLSPFLTGADKHYLAWVSFGAGTPTLDAEGPISQTGDSTVITRDHIEAALPAFLALSEQLPPQFSAIKRGGVKGYEAARKGESLELPPRPAAYHSIQLLDFAPTRAALPSSFSLTPTGSWQPNLNGISFDLPATLGPFPTALLYLSVQAGTYVRAFARDLGAALAVPAHLSGLVRTRAGTAGLEHAIKLEDIAVAEGCGLADALPYPLIELAEVDSKRIRQGQRLAVTFEDRAGLVDSQNNLVAVAENVDGRMNLLRVWQDD